MRKDVVVRCARCEIKKCCDGEDCFSKASEHKRLYAGAGIGELHNAASTIEARYYGKKTRLSEIILFAKELGCQKIGLAFCVGLSEEAKIIENIFSRHFEVVSVCCKVCGIDKRDFDLQQVSPTTTEVMCNSAGQAQLLNDAGAQQRFNIAEQRFLPHRYLSPVLERINYENRNYLNWKNIGFTS